MKQRMIGGLCMLLILSGVANGPGRASGQPTEEQLPKNGGETERISSTRKTGRHPQLPELRQELLERERQDQAIRKKLMDWARANEVEMAAIDFTDEGAAPLLLELQKVDEENRQWLKKIVQEHGWPGHTLVGRDGAHAAWLLVQHADDDPDLQRDCLERMKALPEKEVAAVDVAYLVDRVRLAEGKPQVYGTQIESKDGRWQPINVEDPDNLDRRRKEVGLPSMEAYLWSVRLFDGRAGDATKPLPSDGTPAQPAIPSLEPYPLPSKARQALVELAGKSDILILGETHGTQEVPAIAVALLEPLAKQGYRALALEIPSDQQGALSDWATGKTDTIPSFFAEPGPDGRGNVQVLSLIRIALSPPFGWRLICFDESSETPDEATAAEDPITDWQRRDAKMAANLMAERSRLAPGSKVLAICGNLHARTSKPSAAQKESDTEAGDMLSKLWPSFAGQLRSDLAGRQVSSINVELHGGGYFGTTISRDGKTSVRVQKIRGRKIDEAEAQPLDKQPWDWELNLPRATPATFLMPPAAAADEKLRQELLDRMEKDQVVRKAAMKQKPSEAELTKMAQVDRENTAWLKEVIDQRGWPGKALVGEDGAHAAWLLVQHADLDLAFQKKCLGLLTAAVKKDDASAQDMAYLVDRVRVAEKKPQVYGTQFDLLDGALKPKPIEDEEHVDERRKEVGLPPLSEYLKFAEEALSQTKDEP